MGYTQEQLESLRDDYRDVRQRCDRLVERCVMAQFRTDKAREYARHGLSRRLGVLVHCLERVFARLPPNTTKPPDAAEILDVTVFLQAFVFNVFGCIDNLAHVWVNEKVVLDKDGKALPDRWVGFRKDNKIVLESLPPTFREYLADLEPWFDQLENMRHALAHRIPLYIPPYVIPDDKLTEYHAIGTGVWEAIKLRDYGEADRLEKKQSALTSFEPFATHSFEENAPVVFFHRQMMSDYDYVEEISRRLLEELGHVQV